MEKIALKILRGTFDDYLEAPTGENREHLISSADGYRDAWIADKAGRTAAPRRRTLQDSATSYDLPELLVQTQSGDIPVKLALHKRSDRKTSRSWWTLSWRTVLQPSGYNRRYYYTKGEFWSLPVSVALDLLNQMEAQGGLDEKYFDETFKPDFDVIVSNDLDKDQILEHLTGMTSVDEDWGDNPFFVIAGDPHQSWQKVMLLDTDSHGLTFRSITTDSSYKQRKVLREGDGWYLDNSMLDANVQQMRVFYKHLQQFIK